MPTLPVTITGYWPFDPTSGGSNAGVEGPTHDRRGRPIYTLESYLYRGAPYVSVAGDFSIWPDGQSVGLSAWPGVLFRIVDTGGGFFGMGKRYRVDGQEPLDVAVDSARTYVQRNQLATIFDGDALNPGAASTPASVDYAALSAFHVPVDGDINPTDGEGSDLFAGLGLGGGNSGLILASVAILAVGVGIGLVRL